MTSTLPHRPHSFVLSRILRLTRGRMTPCGFSKICMKKLAVGVLLVMAGMVLGVTLSYHGFLFEDIRVHIEVTEADSANTSTVLQRLGLANTGSNNSQFVVPNIVHYIWFATDGEKQMSFLNYISIRSAYKIQKPEIIMIHCNYLPAGDWWERIWREIPLKIVHREPPAYIHNQRLLHMYHRGDVAKMEILIEYGGIYLDYDVIVVNSMDPLRRYDATLGKEKPPKFIAGIMLARQGSTFMRLMYESYRNNYRPFDWDYNCARVAYQIYVARPDLLHVEPYRLTTPDWLDRRKLWNEVIDWSDLYVIHVMGHFMRETYTPESIRNINSTFGETMRYIYYGSPKLLA